MADRLTRSEVRILRLVGEELSNKVIARRLGLSLKTVENHLTHAYAKLGTSDRRAAALLVARDYPLISQLPPTPMVDVPSATSSDGALGKASPGDRTLSGGSSWFLPAPPRRRLHILGLILAWAAVAGVLTTGLVNLAAGGINLLAPAAPPNGTLALESSSSRTP
jgi:DNA-binding CsgD family transcriptional regulator